VRVLDPAASTPSRAVASLGPVLTLALTAAAFAYVGTVDPNRPGHYPACPVLSLTGVYCPGCGGLRGAHAVAHADLAGALAANALAVAGYAVLAAVLLCWLLRTLRNRPPPRPRMTAARLWGLGGLVLAFTVLRNLPGGTFLTP
jgi:hypothetical protein